MVKCKLCNNLFQESEMSEEHYPAHSVGNDDIVQLDLIKMFESFCSSETIDRINKCDDIEDFINDYFDNELTAPKFPKGRTNRSLCRNCNTFLGKYDEAYLKFFNADGEPKIVRGFQQTTKIQIIKSIFVKFLSVPETENETFDFIEYLQDSQKAEYTGNWNIYFIARDASSDILNLRDIGTGKAVFDEGIVYELSDDKFIFNIMNFPKHSEFKMTNLFDILNKNYQITKASESQDSYHSQILVSRLLSSAYDSEDE